MERDLNKPQTQKYNKINHGQNHAELKAIALVFVLIIQIPLGFVHLIQNKCENGQGLQFVPQTICRSMRKAVHHGRLR
jgi:ABC-type proline/glycine betaine transport system permease subunit